MSVRVYECIQCGARAMARGYPGRCTGCGGQLMNLAVRRE
ncbi:rubrerythrin-like domain-containing protein [Haloglomus litoreum]|nr:rubrerythrin-like domain-containing protein [Haloglomus sp. DT116]